MITTISSETIISKAYCYILQDFLKSSPIPSWPDLSPAGRQNCKPWSERPQSARADFKSWNNDWSSSILGFRCKKFKQNFDLRNSRCWSAKLYLEFFVPKFWLSGCTFDHLSSFLPWRTASVIFTQEDQIASRILQFLIHQKLQDSFFSRFLHKLWSLYSKPLCCALRDQKEKSISKSTPASSDQGQGHLL